MATHHKTGTVWMRRLFVDLSQRLGRPWHYLGGEAFLKRAPEAGRAFLFNWHSDIPAAFLDRSDVACLHLIRDPRDVLISGCQYHRIAPVKGEEFLHQPRADLGGLTYQQHLNALPDWPAQLCFEMDNQHAATLAEMRAWRYDRPNVVELRYEDLIADEDGARIGAALERLGLSAGECAAGRAIFWQNSLFGGLKPEKARGGRLAYHIRSGRAQRWRQELPLAVGRDYAARFGADLAALGYADDDGWLAELGSGAELPAEGQP